MKRFCLILILLLILAAVFAGCTDNDKQETGSPAVNSTELPGRTEANVEQTEANVERTEANVEQTEANVGQTEADGASEPLGSGQAITPAGDPQTTTAMTTEVPFSGMEIEDSYVETVGENVGIGGN